MSIRWPGALAALVLLIAACSPGPGTGGQLEGTRWVLSAYDQAGTLTIVPDTLFADAKFTGNRVEGFAGCNTFDALYRAGGRTLLVSQPAQTLMACDEATMAFEQAFVALLDESRFYSVRRDTLTVFDGIGSTALVFDAAPRNPLLGVWQVDSYSTDPGTVVAVLPETELNVVFRIGSVGGYAGCNSFTGAYGTNGNAVRIGRVATTRLACEQPVMDQEAAFLAALEGSARIESRGSTLNLTDRAGRLQVALARPAPEPGASPAPTASLAPTAEPSPTPGPTETAKPEPTATAQPQPTATALPTEAPPTEAPPTEAPPASPPVSLPPTASCKLSAPDGAVVATITYPGSWWTPAEPPEAVCRFFDPQAVPASDDPATMDAAVMADLLATPYADAVAAATDPAAWAVNATSAVNVRGTPVTCVGAIATSDTAGIPAGTASYRCLADVQTAGTVAIWATGSPGDPAFLTEAAVAGLMTVASTYTPPG